MPSTSIGDIAVAPSNPDIVWVGTGEANLFRASMPGVGIYKSTDAGRTFTHMGLTDTQTIGRIVVHPTNPDIVYVAASGHEWTDNEMRGVFKTTDGGKTWTKVLYKSPRTGAIDLVMDPADPNTLYAAMWQRIRRKWSDPRVEPGYNEGGIWKTTDGGQDLDRGERRACRRAQFRGRIGIDIARSNPNVLYALRRQLRAGPARRSEGERDAYGRPILEARIKAAEVYRTDDKGATWRKVSESERVHDAATRAPTAGCSARSASIPTDENTIYTLGLGAQRVARRRQDVHRRSRGMHGDHHGLWIDPANPAIVYNANDGGFYSSTTAARRGSSRVPAGGAQFYNVVRRHQHAGLGLRLDPGQRQPPRHGSISRRAATGFRRSTGRARRAAKARTTPSIPTNPNIVYSHGFYGNFTRDGSEHRRRRARRPARQAAARRAAQAAGAAAAGRSASTPHPAAGRRSCARSGWRRSSSRRTTRARSTPATSSSSARPTAATPGRRSAPT